MLQWLHAEPVVICAVRSTERLVQEKLYVNSINDSILQTTHFSCILMIEILQVF